MLYFKSVILSFFVLFAGNVTDAHAQDHQHGGHLSTLLEHYMEAKDALTEDDFEAAQSHLAEVRKEASDNEEMKNHGEHGEAYKEYHAVMMQALSGAENAEDIEQLRAAFMDVSDQLTKAVEDQGYDGETLYLQYCPMANDGEGANWLSDEKTIKNPFLSQKMPGCGETEKTLD